MSNSPTAIGDNLSTREQNTLGIYTQRRLLRYRDEEAFVCSACNSVIGVTCPRCGAATHPRYHGDEDAVIKITSERLMDKWMHFYWMMVECQKCSYGFKVIYR